MISGAPIKELPLAHDNRTFVFILVLGVLKLRLRRAGVIGQCTAGSKMPLNQCVSHVN